MNIKFFLKINWFFIDFNGFLDALEEYLSTAASLAPRNAPRKKEFDRAIREFQLMVKDVIQGDMATARKLSEIVDKHTLARLDGRIKQLHAVQMTDHMTEILRRTSQ